jgi:uncharacterized protein YoxC
MGLIMLAILAGLIWVLRLGLRELPYFFKKIQDWVAFATYRVQALATAIANVFLSVRSFWAGARKMAQDVRSVIPFRRRA